ncbi:Arm DNA-binding domain-containing protein [Gilliamella apicola]|uniref:Arm DNA-binding domain-containing protein n=1 Tax=Gilliamella sp. wkB108 TaxID=3120256 RepID=UPI0009BD9AC4
MSNKETLLSFGKYPETSLQQARKQRDEARELIKQGIDPCSLPKYQLFVKVQLIKYRINNEKVSID